MRWRLAAAGFAVAAVLSVAGAGRVTAAPECVTVDYVAGLSRALSALTARPPDVAGARAAVVAAERFTAAALQPLQPIGEDLSAAPPDLADARARLQAIVTALAVPRGATCRVDTSAARGVLNGVYASPVFAHLDQNQSPSILDRVLSFLGSVLSHVTGALGAAGSLALAVLAIGGALAFAAWRLRMILGRRPAAGRDEPAGDGDDAGAEWRAATAAAARGEHREAVRRAFRSVLLELAQRGGVRIDPAWTNRELLASLYADGDLLAALAPAAATFEYAWYSGHAVDAALWEQARERCAALRAMARRRPGAVTP